MNTLSRLVAAPVIAFLALALIGPAGAQQILKGPLAATDIQPARIETGGKPEGTLTIAWQTEISPKWLDPQDGPSISTVVAFRYFLHDALVKNMPQGKMTLSLAEQAEVAADYTAAAFRLRPNLRFHDGTPVTAADVKWSYENFKGQRSGRFREMTQAVDVIDERTIAFRFKRPFPDFLLLYSGGDSGAGMVVPREYYQKVGAAGFVNAPIGAGPFKFVSQRSGVEMVFEAWDQYWRKVPGVARIVVKPMPSIDSRLAGLKTGQVDVAWEMTRVIGAIKADPSLRWYARLTTPYWLAFPNLEDPKNPFHDRRVREAVSLAVNRPLMVQQLTENMGAPASAWLLPSDYADVAARSAFAFDPAKAKALLAEAGLASGVNVDALTPVPFAMPTGDWLAANLQAVGVRSKLDKLDLPKFLSTVGQGRKGWQGRVAMVVIGDPPFGSAAQRIEDYATCSAPFSMICDAKVDEMWKQYHAAATPAQRDRISVDIQNYVLDNFLAVPLYSNAFLFGIGPRVLPPASGQDSAGPARYWSSKATPFPTPWEDWRVKP